MPDPNHELVDFLRAATQSLAGEYERIHRRAAEDPGTAGDQGEENWATLLREWLPHIYHVVTKGRILFHDGTASPQVDVLVLAPHYPPYLLDKKLYLAAGVLAAFECKVTVTAAHLRAAVATGAGIKRRLRARLGTPYRELHSPLQFGLLAHSHSWQSAPSAVNKTVIETLRDEDKTAVQHPRETIDLVCIANLGTWHSSRATWMGPSMITRDPGSYKAWHEGLKAWFGENGSSATSIMGAVIPDPDAAGEPGFTPVGAFLTILLRRLAWEDPGLRPLSAYF